MKVSIVIPNRNDSVMLGVTIRTALECLKEIDNDGEVIVVDNSDDDIYRVITTPNVSPIPLGCRRSGMLKIIRQDFPSMYSARQTGFENASGEYLMGSDSHTIWGRGLVKDCVEFMEKNPDAGIGFSPINWMNRPDGFAKTNIAPHENGGIFGNWGKSGILPSRKICWNFGFRITRKDWYFKIGGMSFFAKKRISWGGGEFYISLKSWLMGRANWSIKTSPLYHIGPFSSEVERLGYRFRQYGASGNGKQGIGILAAFYALGGDKAKHEAAKSANGLYQQHGLVVDRDWPEARLLAEEDHQWILKNQAISFEELLHQRPWEK